MLVGLVSRILWSSNLLRAFLWRYFPQSGLRQRVIRRFFERVFDYVNEHRTVPTRFLWSDFALNQAAEALGTTGQYHGALALHDMLGELEDAVGEVRIGCERLYETPPEDVVILLRLDGVGRASGIPISGRVTAVFRLRRGRATQIDLHYGHPGVDPGFDDWEHPAPPELAV